MATPSSRRFHITLDSIDLDHWRKAFNMIGASDRQVLASIKEYSQGYLNEHFSRIGIQVHRP